MSRDQVTALISAFRRIAGKEEVTPESLGFILQQMIDSGASVEDVEKLKKLITSIQQSGSGLSEEQLALLEHLAELNYVTCGGFEPLSSPSLIALKYKQMNVATGEVADTNVIRISGADEQYAGAMLPQHVKSIKYLENFMEEKGEPDGIAPLDAKAKVPVVNLPDSVVTLGADGHIPSELLPDAALGGSDGGKCVLAFTGFLDAEEDIVIEQNGITASNFGRIFFYLKHQTFLYNVGGKYYSAFSTGSQFGTESTNGVMPVTDKLYICAADGSLWRWNGAELVLAVASARKEEQKLLLFNYNVTSQEELDSFEEAKVGDIAFISSNSCFYIKEESGWKRCTDSEYNIYYEGHQWLANPFRYYVMPDSNQLYEFNIEQSVGYISGSLVPYKAPLKLFSVVGDTGGFQINADKNSFKIAGGDGISTRPGGDGLIISAKPTPIEKVHNASGTVFVEPGKYYFFEDYPDVVKIDINDDSVKADESACIGLFFTTSTEVSFTFGSSMGRGFKYFSGFALKPNTTYELNLMFNGENWIVAYATVE